MPLPRLNDGTKVVIQEEARLLRAKVKLFDMEARGVEVLEPVIFERYSIPVYHSSNLDEGPIGSAHLFYDGHGIWATVVLDYYTPERFDLQVDIPVYATPEGTYYLRGQDFKMDYVDISAVHLSSQPQINSSLVHLS